MGYCNFRNRVTEMFPSYEFWLGAAFAGIIAVLMGRCVRIKEPRRRAKKRSQRKMTRDIIKVSWPPFLFCFSCVEERMADIATLLQCRQ